MAEPVRRGLNHAVTGYLQGMTLTFGVEEEFLVVDKSGHLSFRGAELGRASVCAEGEIQQELARCQVETATDVCSNLEEVLTQLTGLRDQLMSQAHDRDVRLVPSGTPILAEVTSPGITPDTRYRRIAYHFGPIMSTGNTCGCHVHVVIPDRGTGVHVSNHLRPWLPVLLALTANSPFCDGEDTAYSSWRHVLWSRWPSAGPPPLFDSLDHYESSIAALLRAEAMLDRAMVYWDIRLSEQHPTLEFRRCDVSATVEEAALVAVLVRGLVARALQDIDDGRQASALPYEVLRADLWRAARDGFGGSCLDPVSGELGPVQEQVRRLVDHIRPALRENNDADFVDEQLAVLRERGGGAQRQRAAYAERDRLEHVVDVLAGPPTGTRGIQPN